MRFNFDLSNSTARTDSCRSLTPKDQLHWVPLQNHPVFTTGVSYITTQAPRNLVAWDGASTLYLWDPNNLCLHRISLSLGEPDPTYVIAATPSKVLRPDVKLNFEVDKISINRNGSALLLAGLDGLCVMYLYGRNSTKDNTSVCRTVSVGSQIYFNSSNVIRTLQVSWHPYSDTHLGILSSDSVFRLFNLSSDLVQPEQEYYLHPVEPGRSRNAASICPADFSFGGDHLWDRFSVFVLFSDGSIYILCPIVPFGSVYKWESILEIHRDAQTFGLKSANSTAVSNSNMAISWLEATFPELAHQAMDGGNLSTIKAHPYALFNASLSLQGPLRKVCHGGEDEVLAVRGAGCEGRAVGFLYNLISKDSVLVTAWSGGQLQIDALADEIQPVWTVDSPPCLHVDSHNHVLALAMICESISRKLSVVKLDQPLDQTVWLVYPPPLLRLANVDLALPRKTESGSLITMFVDPLMPERIYSLHDGGIDSIVLHFLPFTSQTRGKDETIRSPSVHPVLNTCQEESFSPSPLVGFVSLADSFGYSWIVGVTSTQECIVLEMNTWNLLLPIQVDAEKKPISLEEQNEINTPYIISKELLSGPKVVIAPQTSPNLHSVAADSIEGLSTLHQYLKLFHENYVEYAHKVSFKLKHHGPHLKRIIDDQHAHLSVAEQKLLKVEEKQPTLEDRIDHAMQVHNLLEQRLQRLKLPGAHKKPLSRAKREFKSEIGVELDALRSSIETLRARLGRFTQSSNDNVSIGDIIQLGSQLGGDPRPHPKHGVGKKLHRDRGIEENETMEEDTQGEGDDDEFRELEEDVSSDGDRESDAVGREDGRVISKERDDILENVGALRGAKEVGDVDSVREVGDVGRVRGIVEVGGPRKKGGTGEVRDAEENHIEPCCTQGTLVDHNREKTNAPLSTPFRDAIQPSTLSQTPTPTPTTISPHDGSMPSHTTPSLHDGTLPSQCNTGAHMPPQVIDVMQDDRTMTSHEEHSRDSISVFVDWEVKAEHVVLLEKFREKYGDFWLECELVSSMAMGCLFDMLGKTLLMTQKPWDNINLEDLKVVSSYVNDLSVVKFKVDPLKFYMENASLVLKHKKEEVEFEKSRQELAAFKARIEEMERRLNEQAQKVQENKIALSRRFDGGSVL